MSSSPYTPRDRRCNREPFVSNNAIKRDNDGTEEKEKEQASGTLVITNNLHIGLEQQLIEEGERLEKIEDSAIL